MTQIQDVLTQLPEVIPVQEDPPAGPEKFYDTRIWPAELLAILKNNQRSTKLLVDGPALACQNCGGSGRMFVYTWTGGPYRQPNGGKVKWLEGDGIVSGWYQGETHVAPCPRCNAEAWREYLRANCGLKGDDLNVSVETFKASGPLLFAKEPALLTARSLLSMNTSPSGFVTFWGEPGRGKSHLLKGLVNGFRGLGVFAQYINGADMIADIISRFSDERGGIAVEAVIRQYRNVRVLAIDELDQVSLSTWTKQTLHRLLDTRYEDESLLTVMAMKSSPEQLPVELDYLASRMKPGAVEIGGPDMRAHRKAKQAPLTPAPESEAVYDQN